MKSFAYKTLCGERVCVSHVVSLRLIKIQSVCLKLSSNSCRTVISYLMLKCSFLLKVKTSGYSCLQLLGDEMHIDQPRGLVVRATGYKSRDPGFDSRLYHGDFPCAGRIPVVTMVWVASRIRFKVETSLTRSHTSINI